MGEDEAGEKKEGFGQLQVWRPSFLAADLGMQIRVWTPGHGARQEWLRT